MKTPQVEFIKSIPAENISNSQKANSAIGNAYSAKPYTLITGSSKGIGKAMAYECAQKGMNLLLVALPNEEIVTVKESIQQKYTVQVEVYETDLTQPNASEQLFNWCVNQNISVNILINNAGLGQQGAFENLEIGKKLFLMNINMMVPVSLTHCFLPMLKSNSNSYILNVGSCAAFAPIPYKSLYSASKTFVLSFSRALRYELKDTSIKVCCLCPGPTLTNPQNRLNARSIGRRGTLLEMQPEEVAQYAITDMLAGKEIIVPGWKHKILGFFSRYFPTSITIPYTGKMFSASK